MIWTRLRFYAFIFFFILVCIVIGAVFVLSRSPVVPSQNAITWSGGAPLSAYEGQASQQSPQQIVQEVIAPQTQAQATLSLPPLATSTPTPAATASNSSSDSFDYQAFLAQLSGNTSVSSSVQASNANASTLINEAYQFIPTGLVAATTTAKNPMTAEQQALYDYGNAVGGEIQSFEELHSNQAEILKDQAEDRTDPAKAAALAALGQELAGVGTYMQQMQTVPPDVTSQHNALAQSYIDIGTKLQAVAQAQGDAAFVTAIESYDTSADTFVKNYGTLAQYFSEQGVVFQQQDPGSVFSFTETGGVSGGL